MNLFMLVYGIEAYTTTQIMPEVYYFVGNDGQFSNVITPAITVGLPSSMNAAILAACVADAAANGYTVGLLDAKNMIGGFAGL